MKKTPVGQLDTQPNLGSRKQMARASRPSRVAPAASSVAVTARRPGSHELDFSLFACVVLSAIYVAFEILAEPSGSHPFGHLLGILGTTLMLATETLYSARKRLSFLNWAGPLRWWLSAHIFMGIVGPFLVLMHTGLAFRGLAGVSMALTVLVVGSGFIGRYLYTAIPHTLAGAETSRETLAAESERLRSFLQQFARTKSARVQNLVAAFGQREAKSTRSDFLTLLGRGFYQWRFRRRLQAEVRRLEKTEREKLSELEKALARKRELDRQIDMLHTARRVVGLWHIFHVPLGLTLFSSVAIHVAATLYFRAGLFQ
ncbi:MAG: hypothetical protein ACE5FI_05480 [Anaerolineales bacterium]